MFLLGLKQHNPYGNNIEIFGFREKYYHECKWQPMLHRYSTLTESILSEIENGKPRQMEKGLYEGIWSLVVSGGGEGEVL